MRTSALYPFQKYYVGLDFGTVKDSDGRIYVPAYMARIDWLKANIKSRWTCRSPKQHNDGVHIWKFWFEDYSDAILFKMVWA